MDRWKFKKVLERDEKKIEFVIELFEVRNEDNALIHRGLSQQVVKVCSLDSNVVTNEEQFLKIDRA